jgi:RNA recognition motif-containing protein
MSQKGSRLREIYDREGRNTSSLEPKMLSSRVFIGNLASEKVTRQDVVKMFEPFGKVLGVSLHKSYGFVQFESEKDAKAAVKGTDGTNVEGLRIGER